MLKASARAADAKKSANWDSESAETHAPEFGLAKANALLDEREQLEHREVHADDDHADHRADADHHQRLDDRGQRGDRRVDLVLVEVGDLSEHLLELSRLLADLHHLADHRREDRVLDQGLRDRDALVHLLADVRERFLDDPVASRLPGDLERLDDVHARGHEGRERPREARHRHLQDDVADLHRDLQLDPVPELPAGLGLLEPADAPDRPAEGREDDEPVVAQLVRGLDHPLRQGRQLAVQLGEDVHEDRHEEHQQADQDEGGEDHHHRRVHHRALDAALDLGLLLDLQGDAVEHGVQDSGSLAGLDHRDVEAREDLRVAAERLREQQTALDVGANLADHEREVRIVGLLLEDHQRADDVQAGLDHRRELAREDLQRLRLDLLEDGASTLLAACRQLLDELGEQAADAQLLARGVEIGGMDLAIQLQAFSVDRAVGVRRHTNSVSAG